MADNEVKIKLVVEGNAKVELTAATKAVQEFGDTADKSAKKASGAFDVFKGVLAADAVKAGLGLIQDAATSLFDTFIVDGIAASRGYQDSLNQLSNSLKLSGDFSDAALQSFTELADEIEKNSKVSDDAVLQQAAYAKSLGLSNEQTEKLIRAAVELSAVTGKDLDSSVQELAKSMEGTAGKSLKLLEATKDLTKEQLKTETPSRRYSIATAVVLHPSSILSLADSHASEMRLRISKKKLATRSLPTKR
ncbi:MAG: hypothetical protein E6R04_07985 [Spirochaetes bacterium]|nr:MAG: hypothetical protein E6R04_07985 [Spirochaetota bacterium]